MAIRGGGYLALTSSVAVEGPAALELAQNTVAAVYEEPALFGVAEQRWGDIADRRQQLLDRRIANLVQYPGEQTEITDKLAVRLAVNSKFVCLYFNYGLLFRRGYNVALIEDLNGVELQTVVTATLRHHYDRYLASKDQA